MNLQERMLTGDIVGFTFTLFALRKMKGEPKYNITIRYTDWRESSRGKGGSFDACVTAALGGLPTGTRHILDDLIGELTFHHVNVGVSGLARLPGEPRLFCNMRPVAGGDLKMGRGDNITEAVQEALKK
jgi:hypothetical protein